MYFAACAIPTVQHATIVALRNNFTIQYHCHKGYRISAVGGEHCFGGVWQDGVRTCEGNGYMVALLKCCCQQCNYSLLFPVVVIFLSRWPMANKTY